MPLLLLFSLSVVSDSLWPPGLQHTRRPCPSPSPRVCPGSRTLSPRCHPTKTIVFPIYSPKGPLIFLKSHLLFLTSLSPSPSALFLSSHLFSLKFPLPPLTKMDISLMAFPPSSVSKESTCNAEDLGSIPGSGRSSGEGNGNPLQSSCLENPMDRGAWRATVHGVTTVRHLKKKWCQTSHHTYKHTPYHYHHLNNASIKTENTYKECMHTESLQSCPTLCDPMGRSLPGSSVPEILQARILEWVAVPSSRESFRPRDQTLIA